MMITKENNIKRLLSILVFFLYCIVGFSQWNPTTEIFVTKKYNLQWNLSGIGNWRIADATQRPNNMLFCAALEDEPVVLNIMAMEEQKAIEDLWSGSDSFIDGLVSQIKKQSSIFPGMYYLDTKYNNCYFLYKKALKFNISLTMQDNRLGTNEAVPFQYIGYMFFLRNALITANLLLPKSYIDEYGDQLVDMLFSKLSYYDMSKELNP